MSNASSIAAGRLYRVMDFSRVVQMFEKQELYFSHPTAWDDPFEKRVEHQSSHALFAQCWCQIGISDAMWRIYSQNGMGVRISTTTKKLSRAVRAAIHPFEYGWDCRQVETSPSTTLTNAPRPSPATWDVSSMCRRPRVCCISSAKRSGMKRSGGLRSTARMRIGSECRRVWR